MLPFKLIYSEGYDLNLGEHVFPAVKYRMIREKLLADRLAAPEDFLEPAPASDEDVSLVHHVEYVHKLKQGRLSYAELLRLEIPYSQKMVEAFWLAAGGSILAARQALQRGAAVNIGGGFHHAFPDHGEGFCAIHDVAIAIRRLQKDAAIQRAAVVDCDVHQGNGTAAIFGGDQTVFTLSLHQANNYPQPKPPSSLDVNLPDGTGDAEYLRLLEPALETALGNGVGSGAGDPGPVDMVFYVAGADPFCQDQLGGLGLTKEGLKKRDTLVFAAARRRGMPVMVTFAGGYARRVEDTVEIHVNTIRALREAL